MAPTVTPHIGAVWTAGPSPTGAPVAPAQQPAAPTGVTATVLHPGVVRSGFGAEDPGRIQRLITPFMRFLKSPEQGARTSIHLASSPEVEGVTGQFFADSKPRRSSRRSYDEAAALRLWEVSAELVGLDAGTAGRLGPARRDAS